MRPIPDIAQTFLSSRKLVQALPGVCFTRHPALAGRLALLERSGHAAGASATWSTLKEGEDGITFLSSWDRLPSYLLSLRIFGFW